MYEHRIIKEQRLHNQDNVICYCETPNVLLDIAEDYSINRDFHVHDFHLICWVKKGSGVHTINTSDYIIEDNEIFFMAPGDGHKIAPGDGEQCWVSILVSERLLELLPEKVANNIRFEVFDTWDKAPVAKMDDSTAEALQSYLDKLIALMHGEIHDDGYAMAAFLSVILSFLRNHAAWNKSMSNGSSEDCSAYFRFRRLVNERIHKSHNAIYYAKAMNLPTIQLKNMVEKASGMSPTEWIKMELIRRSKRLLAEGNFNIKQISEILGFSDASHFGKFFKRETSCTPLQFMKKCNSSIGLSQNRLKSQAR